MSPVRYAACHVVWKLIVLWMLLVGGYPPLSGAASRWMCYYYISYYFWLGVQGLAPPPNNRRPPRRDDSPRHQPEQNSHHRRIQILTDSLRVLYQHEGTLGILQRTETLPSDVSGEDFVQAVWKASRAQKGTAAGMLNALLGVTCRNNEDLALCLAILQAYDAFPHLQPDLVTLCLAHVTLSKDPKYNDVPYARSFLKRAEQLYPTSANAAAANKNSSLVDWTTIQDEYDIHLLHESNEFVVLSKPSGMVCYHSTTAAGSTTTRSKKQQQQQIKKNKPDLSLEEFLLRQGLALSTLNCEGRGMVHRIDRGTSGCLVVAKTNAMHAQLLVEFFLRNVEKSYQAWVYDDDTTTAASTNNNSFLATTLKTTGTVVIDLPIDGRPAVSTVRLLESSTVCRSNNDATSSILHRVQIKTKQGRRHQVRKHLSQGLGMPIVLDPLYGGEKAMTGKKSNNNNTCWKGHRQAQRFALHADTLGIPSCGIHLQAPLPKWWQDFDNLVTTEK